MTTEQNQQIDFTDEGQVDNFENEGNHQWGYVDVEFHKYICEICNHIYNEATGEPSSGISAGTLWPDVSNDWRCPTCSAMKSNFKFME